MPFGERRKYNHMQRGSEELLTDQLWTNPATQAPGTATSQLAQSGNWKI